jgi:enoyl-CoA hydratase/carnithine racemase
MDFIAVDIKDDVAVFKLQRSVTNPLNLDFLKEISSNLHDLEKNPKVRAIVLTSTNDKFFSIGFDLPYLITLKMDDVEIFYTTYNQLSVQLFSFPKPVVAAINGHAIAGGCILALCCDYRFISEGRKLMGLNEIKLGLPVPYPGDRILHQIVGSQYAKEIMEIGEFYPPEASLQMGMVDQVFPLEQVLAKSIERAKLLGNYPAHAYMKIKENRVEKVKDEIQKSLEEKQRYFLKCWEKDETQNLLKEATKKF